MTLIDQKTDVGQPPPASLKCSALGSLMPTHSAPIAKVGGQAYPKTRGRSRNKPPKKSQTPAAKIYGTHEGADSSPRRESKLVTKNPRRDKPPARRYDSRSGAHSPLVSSFPHYFTLSAVKVDRRMASLQELQYISPRSIRGYLRTAAAGKTQGSTTEEWWRMSLPASRPMSTNCITVHLPMPTSSSSTPLLSATPASIFCRKWQQRSHHFDQFCAGSNNGVANLEEQAEVEVAKGYTMTQFCDRMIEVFMHEKPKSKDWRKLLVFRDEWQRYKGSFFDRCRVRAEAEIDPVMKQKLIGLARKVKKIDDEMEKHAELLKEIHENPLDINAVVARRRKDFNAEFFRHINVLSDVYDNLEDRDAMARLGAKSLSAVRAYDNAMELLETIDVAQAKFDDILNSPSLDVACEKIKSLAKSKELDSSLILLINRAWGAAKESTTMKNEVKEIMHQIYKETKKSIKSIAPPEIKLLKYLLNITDPEERFSALATAFSPGDEHEVKDANSLYTTPEELHKWIKVMLDAYHLNKEETEVMEARQMSDPMVIQRLYILKETIEGEYMKPHKEAEAPESRD